VLILGSVVHTVGSCVDTGHMCRHCAVVLILGSCVDTGQCCSYRGQLC
jgi:hypothetical protein